MSEKMIAVHLEAGRVEIRTVDIPERPKGFALIRMLAAGICNTDLELQRGYYGFTGTPGHEFVGEVVEADNQTLIGKRVVGEINMGCTKCKWCIRIMQRHCPKRTVLGIVQHPGAFAEFLTLPERNLRVVPDSIPTDVAVFTEPLAAARRILDQCVIDQGYPVAVLGDGKLGLLVAQVLQQNGCRVYLYGHHPEKLKIAESAGVRTKLSHYMPHGEFEWVVEATGSADGLREAIRMTEPTGRIIMKSTVHDTIQMDTAPIIVNEIALIGSRCGRFEPALDLLTRGAVDVTSMISEKMSLSEAARGFELAARKGVLKVILEGGR